MLSAINSAVIFHCIVNVDNTENQKLQMQSKVISVVVMLQLRVSVGKPPNIVVIIADDLGWNDVSWHNPDVVTPNLQKLADNGVILNSSYFHPKCSPSR